MEDLVWLYKQSKEIIESNRRALELYSFVWSALEDNQIAAGARGLIIDPCSHNIEGQAHALVKTIVKDKRGVLMWAVLDTILTSDKLARHYKRLLQDIEFIAEDELIEVTPKSIRMRKRILDNATRMKEKMRNK